MQYTLLSFMWEHMNDTLKPWLHGLFTFILVVYLADDYLWLLCGDIEDIEI